jgi:hypothetical protein
MGAGWAVGGLYALVTAGCWCLASCGPVLSTAGNQRPGLACDGSWSGVKLQVLMPGLHAKSIMGPCAWRLAARAAMMQWLHTLRCYTSGAFQGAGGTCCIQTTDGLDAACRGAADADFAGKSCLLLPTVALLSGQQARSGSVWSDPGAQSAHTWAQGLRTHGRKVCAHMGARSAHTWAP